jgi:ribosome assembly protein YihI (activator of Der GTPase)
MNSPLSPAAVSDGVGIEVIERFSERNGEAKKHKRHRKRGEMDSGSREAQVVRMSSEGM